MIVKQVWTGNDWRNFNYLVACADTGEALAIDPLAHDMCLDYAQDQGWEITQVLNTHEHHDHVGGNAALIAATGAQLLAHKNAWDRIVGIDRPLAAGDVIRVGRTVELEALDTPGHTMSHVCLLSHGAQPALFCGDTLFNAGAGNCHNGGHPNQLYLTFSSQLANLPDDTLVYPGHDYILNNLRFTLSREPGNAEARTLHEQLIDQDPAEALVTTIGMEKRVNTFLRLNNPEVIAGLREQFPDLPAEPDEKTVFLKLRELRNEW